MVLSLGSLVEDGTCCGINTRYEIAWRELGVLGSVVKSGGLSLAFIVFSFHSVFCGV